jgi:hypothetical protein
MDLPASHEVGIKVGEAGGFVGQMLEEEIWLKVVVALRLLGLFSSQGCCCMVVVEMVVHVHGGDELLKEEEATFVVVVAVVVVVLLLSYWHLVEELYAWTKEEEDLVLPDLVEKTVRQRIRVWVDVDAVVKETNCCFPILPHPMMRPGILGNGRKTRPIFRLICGYTTFFLYREHSLERT